VPPWQAPAGDPAACLRLAWVGRLEQPQKRVHDLPPLLEALQARGIEAQLTVAGDGEERPALEQALAPWMERGRVRMLGHIDQRRLADRIYGHHHALVITSAWETGPIVAWQAMASGMAVVSSRYVGSGLEDALRHDTTALLFPCGDVAAAAEALARLRQSALLERLSRGGHALVAERYSEAASLAAWQRSLQAVMALPPLPPPPPEPAPPAAGRLDRWLGSGLGEDVRRLLGLRFRHGSAGSEWPHSGSGTAKGEALLETAAGLDHPVPPPPDPHG
jgi:hypothetical protein